jgi:hypothetical protein
MSGHVRSLSRPSRLQLMLIGGAIALAFLVGAAKASADTTGDGVSLGAGSDAGTLFNVSDLGGVSHPDPYGKG